MLILPGTGPALPWMLQGTIEENKRDVSSDPNSDWIDDDTAYLFMMDPGAGRYKVQHPQAMNEFTGLKHERDKQRIRTSARCQSYYPARRSNENGAVQISEWLLRSENFEILTKTQMLDRYLEVLMFRKALRVTDNNNTNLWIKIDPLNDSHIDEDMVHCTDRLGNKYCIVSVDETMDRVEVKKPLNPTPYDKIDLDLPTEKREDMLLTLYSGKPPKQLLKVANERLTSDGGIEHFSNFLRRVIQTIEDRGPANFKLAFGETRGKRIYYTVVTGANNMLECLKLRQLVLK